VLNVVPENRLSPPTPTASLPGHATECSQSSQFCSTLAHLLSWPLLVLICCSWMYYWSMCCYKLPLLLHVGVEFVPPLCGDQVTYWPDLRTVVFHLATATIIIKLAWRGPVAVISLLHYLHNAWLLLYTADSFVAYVSGHSINQSINQSINRSINKIDVYKLISATETISMYTAL